MKTSHLITIAAVVLGLTGAGCEYTKLLYPIDGKGLTESTKVEETTETIVPLDPASPSPDVLTPEPPAEEILPEEVSAELPPSEIPPEDPLAVSGDTTPPTVVDTSPQAGVDADLDSTIGVLFSEAMDPTTITPSRMVITKMPAGVPVPVVGVDQISPTTVGWILDNPLEPDTLYTVVINRNVRDQAGNRMATHYGWSFRTQVVILY